MGLVVLDVTCPRWTNIGILILDMSWPRWINIGLLVLDITWSSRTYKIWNDTQRGLVHPNHVGLWDTHIGCARHHRDIRTLPPVGGLAYPLSRGTKELTMTWLELIGWTRPVTWTKETRGLGLVGCIGTEVSAEIIVYWEVGFCINGDVVGIAPDAQTRLWYNDEVVGMLETNWDKIM